MRHLAPVALCRLGPRFLSQLLLVGLSNSLLQAQTLNPKSKLLLPEEAAISGMVIDSLGNAIAEVSIEHAAAFNRQRRGMVNRLGPIIRA
jgi:hypothetical protein